MESVTNQRMRLMSMGVSDDEFHEPLEALADGLGEITVESLEGRSDGSKDDTEIN